MDELSVPELSDQRKADFDREGYLHLRQVISAQQVDVARGVKIIQLPLRF